MKAIARTPLEAWIGARIGLEAGERPTPERLAAWQLARLNETLTHAHGHSPFYQRQWGARELPRLRSMEAIGTLPFTSAEVLRRDALRLLCVSQSEVARVVTLNTSGTTGDPKRIFFTEGDLEATVDFFHNGMSTLVRPGERVLILLPGERPDSVGDLLRRGLARMGVEGIVHGPVQDPALAVRAIIDHPIDSLVGIPVQVLALARHPESARIAPGTLRSVLLSTDYVPRAIEAAIREAWGCRVFQHYGMTEMGFGGGVACAALSGYHLREADLLFEIIDPVTAAPVRPGRTGEVVFTTLTRRAMPLIRYRTGDLAAWIDAPCPCGSVLRRMGPVQGRRNEMVRLADGIVLGMNALDEALFALPGVVDFAAGLRYENGSSHLRITLAAGRDHPVDTASAAAALQKIPAIRAAAANGALILDPVDIERNCGPAAGPAKRRIVDRRRTDPHTEEH
jgi:phenylacetate-coenzyme A ligase PaaK-like adenylate-forming protein